MGVERYINDEDFIADCKSSEHYLPEMSDQDCKYEASDNAKKIVLARLAKSAFKDIEAFTLMIYTHEELEDMGEDSGNWVGQYVRGSVDSDRGISVLINIDEHEGTFDMADTISHEIGHAVWELLDDEGRERWTENQKDHKYGPEEAFADDFMYMLRGVPHLMNNEELFNEITQTE